MYWIKENRYIIGSVKIDGAIAVPERPTSAHSWDGSQWFFNGFSLDEALNELRIQRNQLLAQTDWRMTTDYPYSDQDQWASYRTSLRNLPATAEPTLDESGKLIVDWPQAPSQI